jgi:L-rhamnose mutarotase
MFSYFEYTGEDFETDMAKMAADETTRQWWKACTPDFDPYEPGQYWAPMEELYHLQ